MKPAITQIECLGAIGNQVEDFIDKHELLHVAIEQTIYVQNFQTAQILGAARGAAIAVASMRGLPVFEYAPLRIKQAVAGVARTRRSVDRNVSALMSMANIPSRGEYERVHARLNAVQNSIRNLSRRLDDLNRQIEGAQKTKGARKAPARKSKAKTGSAKSAKPKTAKSRSSKSKSGKTTRSASAAGATKAKPKAKTKAKRR